MGTEHLSNWSYTIYKLVIQIWQEISGFFATGISILEVSCNIWTNL